MTSTGYSFVLKGKKYILRTEHLAVRYSCDDLLIAGVVGIAIILVGKEGRKCLINDELNTFYLRLYGIRHM